MITRLIFTLSLLLAPCSLLFAAPPPELTVLRTQYENVLAERVTSPFVAAKTELDTKFISALERTAGEVKKTGDLEAVLAINSDRKRLTDKLPIPAEDDEQTPEALKKLRVIYREQLKKLEDQRAAAQRKMLPGYTEKLKALETTLTKADRIDEAKEIKDYREGLAMNVESSSAPPSAPVTKAEPAAGGKVTAATTVAAKGDDRKAAEWVLSVGGQVVMLDRKKEVACSKPADIPGGSPKLIRLNINSESRGNAVKPFTAEDTQCLKGLAELQGVFFNTKNIDFSSGHLAFLSTCPNVTEVSLWYPKVDAGFLEHLVPLSKLRVFKFCYGKCTPLKLSRLQSRSLSEVSFQFSNFTDETVLELAAQTEMELLWLDQSSATDAGLAAVKGMKKLKGLGVENTKITIEGLRSLAGLKLKALHFGSANAADYAEAGKLFPSVQQFVMQRWGTHPDAAFLGLAATLPDLDHLVAFDAKFPDPALPSLAEFKKLTWLELVRSELTDAAVPAIVRMKSLHRLTLDESRLTESGLSQLKKLKSLKTLSIRGITEIGDAAVKDFQKARPDVKVEK